MYITQSLRLYNYCTKKKIYPKRIEYKHKTDPITSKERVWRTWFYEITDEFVDALEEFDNMKIEYFNKTK